MLSNIQNVYEDKYNDFIQHLYNEQANFPKMAAIVLRTLKPANDSHKKLDEMVQLVRFCLNGYGVFLLKSVSAQRIFIVVRSQNARALAIIETSIKKEFVDNDVFIELSVALDTGIQKFCEILSISIPETEKNALLELRRLGRAQKVFLTLVNEKDILGKLEKILKSFGRVISCQNKDQFLSYCVEYAPNAVFVDADYYASDPDLAVHNFKKQIDKNCKYFVISKNSGAHLVRHFLEEGVSGFLLHPVTAESLLNQFSRLRLLNQNYKLNLKG